MDFQIYIQLLKKYGGQLNGQCCKKTKEKDYQAQTQKTQKEDAS